MKKAKHSRLNERNTPWHPRGTEATYRLIDRDEYVEIVSPTDAIWNDDGKEAMQEYYDRMIANNGNFPTIVLKRINGGYRLLQGERKYRMVLKLGFKCFEAIVYDEFSEPELRCASDGAPYTKERYRASDKLENFLTAKKDALHEIEQGVSKGGLQKKIAARMGVSTRTARKYQRKIEAVGEENIDTVTNIAETAKLT